MSTGYGSSLRPIRDAGSRKLEGHLIQREGEQLGCRAAGVDYTVRLVLYAG